MSFADDMTRYSCQVALPGFGREGQAKLAHARVLIVGLGGLGCPAAQYLVSAGVGNIGLVDFDTVSASNLHRQILYGPADIGKLKSEAAVASLSAQNPGVKLTPHTSKISHDNVASLVSDYDLVIDCTDNFVSRYLLNDASVLAGKPLIYGAIYQFEGQVSIWNITNEDGSKSPNYRDLFPEIDASQIPNCAEGGVIPTLAGIIGCMQANEAIKYFIGSNELLAGRLLLFDALSMTSRIIKTGRRTKTSITEIQHQATVETLDANTNLDDYALIDVREFTERAIDHIGGLHIPLKELMPRLQEIPLDKDIVFYCASGRRSEEAARIASKMLSNIKVFSLEGGLRAYRERAAIQLS